MNKSSNSKQHSIHIWTWRHIHNKSQTYSKTNMEMMDSTEKNFSLILRKPCLYATLDIMTIILFQVQKNNLLSLPFEWSVVLA